MEADWQEVTRIGFPPPGLHAQPTPVSTFAFDDSQELLWTGNGYGRVTSFYGPDLQRYTSYRGHGQQESGVKQLLMCEKGVISVSSNSVHLANRRGMNQWHATQEDFQDLCCMSFSSKVSEILVAGCQNTMFRMDVDKGTVIETITAPDHYTLMKRGGQYICAATSTGSVHLLDPKDFSVLRNWKAHMGWINDLDANSNFLVTCGWSPRQQYGNVLDPLAKVFDLKTLMPLPPVPFHAGAAFVRMHPRMLTTGIVASQTGQLQLVDIMNSAMVSLRQVNLVDSYLVSLEVAPSGEALVLTDSACTIQLWGSPQRLHFTTYQNPTEFPDDVPPPITNLDWSNNEPLSSVGMPFYRETLLSAWPSHMVFEVGAPPPRIDPAILGNLRKTEFGAFAPNPRRTLRNQVQDTRAAEKTTPTIEGPKFLSEQARDTNGEDSGRRMSEVLEAMTSTNIDGHVRTEIPTMYRNVEIKYSKFGVDDFDFEFFNKTKFSGLETHIANSYANSLLQLLKFIPWIRNSALHHTATPCLFESCLLCEMGFLFDMLEKANGQNCQATNFLKTFSSLSHSASLGLLEDSVPARPLTLMLQSTNRFLLEKIAADYRQVPPHNAHMDHILTTVAVTRIRCAHCANETARPGGTYVHELVYPPRPQTKHGRSHGPTFSQILKASVERQDQTRGWCDRCKRYQQLVARKTIQNVPPVLMINAAVHSSDAKQLWSKPRWLPQEIGIIVEQGQFFCYEGQDLQVHLQRGAFNIQVYELIGVVCDINSDTNSKSHLVSMVNVSPSLSEKDPENHWHLFNDFLVRKVGDEEALRFDPTWKLPSVLAYQSKTARHYVDDTWKDKLDTSLLYRRWPMSQTDDPALFRTLDYPSERPQPGTPVGIDAEFVALQQEELEIKADGSRSTIRPSRLGLARVSVLRGGEPTDDIRDALDAEQPLDSAHEDERQENPYMPFIDDYIQIPEPIIDYLTAFSGISPGDLDPKTSPHASTGRLISLKTAYKKIWLLLNLGCVFVGHGLLKDFRTINIHIPKKQVVDTVDLYYLKNRGRKLSLRFLSWLLLGEEVQVGMHDSVEDARMALRLWRRWQEYETEDEVENMLTEVYKKGRQYGFKVPSASPSSGSGAMLSVEGGSGAGARLALSEVESGRATPEIMGMEMDRSMPGTPRTKAAILAEHNDK